MTSMVSAWATALVCLVLEPLSWSYTWKLHIDQDLTLQFPVYICSTINTSMSTSKSREEERSDGW